MTRARTFLAALLSGGIIALFVTIGCSGLSPQDPGDGGGNPPPPGSPCGALPQLKNFLTGGIVVPLGTDTTLDLAAWNIETFPLQGSTTITKTADIIRTLNLDVWGLEEISDTTAFRALMNQLPDYGSVYSPDIYQNNCDPSQDLCYQKTGFIYKKSIVTVDGVRIPSEFASHSYEFVDRIPLEISFTVRQNNKSYSFKMIEVHLKAGVNGDPPQASDSTRRRAASKILHDYMDAQALANPGVDYVVAGDWNDYLTDPPTTNSFPSFLNDNQNYIFLTSAFIGHSEYNTHPLGQIDQILVNRNACPDFSKGRISTLRLDQIVPSYSTLVSDHRPVFVQAPVFK